MSSPGLSVSVVLCAYTEARWHDLVAAVQSVQAQSQRPREIIVVVDYNPALLERARANMPGVVVIENHEFQGLSGARNSGVSVASGEIIAFLDDDAEAEPNWLEQLVAGYTMEQIIGVGGAIAPWWLTMRPSWFPDEFNWVVGCTYRGLPETASQVRNLIGANMSFRREVFDVVGGFHNGVGQVGNSMLRCDDTEFCIRVTQQWRGGTLLYNPQASVRHRVPESRATWVYFRSRCYTEGLAKAVVARYVGSDDALSSERTYTLKTLPSGVAKACADALFRGDPVGLLRASAIIIGFVLTATGYLRGTFSAMRSTRQTTMPQNRVIQAEAASR